MLKFTPMSKTKKIIFVTIRTLFLAALGAASAGAVFVYTSAGPYLFGSNQVLPNNDEYNRSQIAEKDRQIREANQKVKDLETKVKTANDENTKILEEIKELEMALEAEKEISKRKNDNFVKFREQKNSNSKIKNGLADILEKAQTLQGQLFKARNAVHGTKASLRAVEEVESQIKKHQAIINGKYLEVLQAARFNWSPTKEFFLYIFGLKILWGLFTGYRATTSTYYQNVALQRVTDNFNKEKEELETRLAEAREGYQKAYNYALEMIQKAELQASYNPELQQKIGEELRIPFVNTFEEVLKASTKFDRASLLFEIKVNEVLGRFSNNATKKLAKQIQEEFGVTNLDPNSLYKTTFESLNQSRENLEKVFAELEETFGSIVTNELKVYERRKELDELNARSSVYESEERKITGETR